MVPHRCLVGALVVWRHEFHVLLVPHLDSAPRGLSFAVVSQYQRLGFKAVQGYCSGSLVILGQKLHLTVGQGCWLGSLPKCGCRMGSVAAWVLWPVS